MTAASRPRAGASAPGSRAARPPPPRAERGLEPVRRRLLECARLVADPHGTRTLRTAALLACLAALLAGIPGCAGLAPSWSNGVAGVDASWPGPRPESVSVGGLTIRSDEVEERFVHEAFMAELRGLGLLQDEGAADMVFLGDIVISPPHAPLGGHDIWLTLSAAPRGTGNEVWWCRVYREYDVYLRTRDEIKEVLAKAARMFGRQLERWPRD